MADPGNLRINPARLWETLMASAEIGKGREGGLARLALSDSDRDMRALFATWCAQAGLSLSVDAMGNMFARRKGRSDSLPPVVFGSHLDTQYNGGRFDGILGVLGALEVIRTLDAASVQTERPLVIVNWTNEEGARFSPPMVASGVFAGAYSLEFGHSRTSDDGATLGGELARIGYLGAAPMGFACDSYFELHIEQGPILDAQGMQVGIVTGGYTSTGMAVEFRGETAHTGPWPMERRRNALVAGARLLVALDELGWEFAGSGGKATAARLVAWPNKPGILSDWAQAVCDVRHADPAASAVMAERVRRAVFESAARAGCSADILDIWTWGGAIFDNAMIDLVRQTTARLGYRSMQILSQAGHDAYFMARHCPTTMIFTPCKGGITHNNLENCSIEDIEPGTNVLLHAVLARANRPSG